MLSNSLLEIVCRKDEAFCLGDVEIAVVGHLKSSVTHCIAVRSVFLCRIYGYFCFSERYRIGHSGLIESESFNLVCKSLSVKGNIPKWEQASQEDECNAHQQVAAEKVGNAQAEHEQGKDLE